MDVLEKYKKVWKNQPTDTQKISKEDIYKMMHKKSSSVAKWIFFIGILEFALMLIIYYIDPEIEGNRIKNTYGAFSHYLDLFFNVILLYFVYEFYKNYKSISASDSTKKLLTKILKTRKTVKNYFIFNLVIIFISFFMVIFSDEEFSASPSKFIIGVIIVLPIMYLFYWLYYQLLYGILLRKLNRNYKELFRLENQ